MSLAENTATPEGAVTVALLERIGDAFNSHDVDRIMGFFAEESVFDNAKGPDVHGQRIAGKAAIRAAFDGLMERCPDIRWIAVDNRVAGDKGFSEWRRQCTGADGQSEDWLGLDIFTFRGGLIARKDSYFKIVG